jgi:alpha-methylacyl-CoA racemase
LRIELARIIRQRNQAQWMEVFEGSDACVAPILSMEEAPAHPHNRARGVFVEQFGVVQPAPAPRFSATPGAIRSPPPRIGQHTRQILLDQGYSNTTIDELVRAAVVGTAADDP